SLDFTPDSKAFLVGGLRGSVMCCDLNAKLLWTTSLMPHNQSLARTEFPNVDPAIPDSTGKLFKPLVDEPGELDRLVTLDRSRLVNSDFEGDGGWQMDTNAETKAASVSYAEGGYQSKHCLKVGGDLVQQSIEGLIGDHFTWVLEFFYRRATPGTAVGLLAGLSSENRHPDNVVRVLACDKDWKFARIAFKSGADAKRLSVGFQGQGGEALVDGVSLRRIRFPSVNHMLYPPLYDVEPVVLHNPLFLKDYNPLGVLREQIPNVVLSQRPEQIADALIVDAFLQNGRLNDISSDWHWSYLGGADTQISMGIRNPRWVSMVAIYFNAYDEANTPRNFDVLVSDVAQKKVTRVAMVRNNRSLFRLVKFPARRVDEVRVVLVNTLPRQRTVTEIEVYGPLSGGEKGGVADEAGQNTYMGTFARVDHRRMPLAAGYDTKSITGASTLPRWATPVSQVMMSERNVYISRALGFNQRLSLDVPDESLFRTGGMGFGPVMTLYGGALLKPGSDGKLYCIDPDSGRAFWSTVLGERLTGCPAVIGLDVFAATDAGKLYTLDIASGAILGETKLSGPVYGSVASDGANLYVISGGGRLHAVQAISGRELWSVGVATNTDSTPAVDGGVVYLADQKGTAMAVQSTDGKVLWSRELGSEFCRCPVVLPELIVFGGSDGRLTALNRRTGEQVWQTQLDTRFLRYEPVPVLLPGPVPVMAADATNSVAASAAAPPVLLCLSAGKPVLIDVASGKPA
ncbi:MAG: PQQ-binding-like beta-propeller repeat protein, partial [bacterium]